MKNAALILGFLVVLCLVFVWFGAFQTTHATKSSSAQTSMVTNLKFSKKTEDVEKMFAKQKQVTKRAKEILDAVTLFAKGDPETEAVVAQFVERMEPMLMLKGGGYMHLAHNEAPLEDAHLFSRVPFVFIDPEVAGAFPQHPKVAVVFNGSVILYRTDAPIHEEMLSVVMLHAISSWVDREKLGLEDRAAPLDTTAQVYANAKILVNAYSRECAALDRARNGTLKTEISRVLLDASMVEPSGYMSLVTPSQAGMAQLQDVIFPYGAKGKYEVSLQMGSLFTCVFLQQSTTLDERVRSFEWLFFEDGGKNVRRLAVAGGATQ